MTDKIAIYMDTVLPISLVIGQAREFLDSCNWCLEIDDENTVTIPSDTLLFVRSRAFVLNDDKDVFGNHFQAIVEVGRETIGSLTRPKYVVLKLYFNLSGRMITEDRFSIYH